MKNKIYILALFLIFGIAATSCKKETGPVTKTETPMQKTISEQLVVDTVRVVANGSWEFGQKLFFSKNGKITKMGCKMANTGSYRVSLWDFATKNLIAATTVTVTDSTKFIYNNVSPIDVTANTRYVLSVNNTSLLSSKLFYVYEKKSNTTRASIYPFTTGSVTYEAQAEKFSTTSVFPPSLITADFLDGIPDIQFEYTE